MKVKLAKTAGFCMGVKRAVELVLKTAASAPGKIYTWGYLIHNPQTVDFLTEQGVGVLDAPEEIPEDSTVVIRSHGIPPDEREQIASAGAKICDATCPRVARVHGTIKKNASAGRDVVIVGNPEHAEVKGLLGYAGDRGSVISTPEQAAELPNLKRPVVVGQTTLNRERFLEVAEAVKNRFPGSEVIDTLCDSTSRRQREVIELAKDADAVVVVGGYISGNTRRLFEVAKSTGVPSFWVETADELNVADFEGMETVAVTAGASTPHWIVSRVIERLERFGERGLRLWETPFIKKLGYILIQSNVLTGLAAACLTLGAALLSGLGFAPGLALAGGLFVFAMHTVYNLVDWQGLALVDPSKIRFFWGNRRLLTLTSVIALVLALPLVWLSGTLPGILMLFGVLISALFAFVKRLPPPFKSDKITTWREIPGAKDILHTAGWFFAAGVIPASVNFGNYRRIIPALVWVLSLSLLRATLFSITDLETDRVLGRQSLATIIGERGSWIISAGGAIIAAASIMAAWLMGYLPATALFALAIPIYMLLLIARLRRSGIYRGTWAELAVDLGFVIGGIAAGIALLSG